MTSGGSPVLQCAECGSTRLRAGHPRGLLELLARAVTGARFHVCTECGARGTHRGRYPSRKVKRRAAARGEPGLPVERRDVRAAAHLARRRVAMVLVALALGGVAGYYVWSCEKTADERRPEVLPP